MNENIILSSLPEAADAIEIAKISQETSSAVLYVALDDRRMSAIARDLSFFAPSIKTIQIPAWDCLPYDRISPSMHIANLRTESLCELASIAGDESNLKNTVIITTVNSLLQRIPPKEILKNMAFIARVSDEIDREELVQRLVRSGYVNSPTANEAGEFALRGSIIDILPSGSENGYRLDFFGEKLDSIKEFSPLTQISGKKHDFIKLTPASEIVIDESSIERFRKYYRKLFGTITGDDPLYSSISEGRTYAGMEHWLPLFYDHLDTIFDYLPNSITITFDHLTTQAKDERLDLIEDYYQSRKSNDNLGFAQGDDYKAIAPKMLYLDESELASKLENYPLIYTNPYHVEDGENSLNIKQINEQPYKQAPSFHVEAKAQKKNSFEIMKEYTRSARKKTIIACFSAGSRDRMVNMLDEHDIFSLAIDKWSDAKKIKGKTVGLITLQMEKGFESEDLIIISEQDLLGLRISSGKAGKKRSDKLLMETASLAEGELVVHKENGLGRFEALETLTVSGQNHDCLRISYSGGDKLYVPVENIDSLTKYGSEGEEVRLDKLGSASWQSRKANLKKRIKVIAEDLIKVAAERLLKKASPLSPTEGIYEEFCARFPYAETEDQLRCIEDVRSDLSSGRPMDRLICGDVGFGKTEIALRAAFIAASDGKQVAIISPTTLLCRQHNKTFRQRFAGMPFTVRDLSRLTSPKEAKETKQLLAEGKVDIVVGTHALLAKSLKIKNLGLVVIDEEQQFGVAQKERFKQIRSDIHVLSLSATPIPRTMQMSLTGVKDLSIIATPPVDRLAIRCFTLPFDPVVIRNAILREHYRGGSIFFVVPKIKDIDEMYKKLEKLIPEVKIAKAHGQLSPTELDGIMTDFYDRKFDILLSTNIVGSGIDIPTANTIIVHKADLFGLSQLYQMRGRVGRSKIRAYAYFTTVPKKIPSKTALKRLEVIQNIDSLGAGFSVASHDMDIRGFGNMLGDEQSGQIKEVGIELYQEMLKEAVENAKAHQDKEDEIVDKWSPNINLGISVLIPEDYITDIELRLGLYRRIANLETREEIEDIAVEMIDRFGQIPDEVKNLLNIMKIKQKCLLAGVEKIDAGSKGIVISFRNDTFKNPEALIEFISKNPLKTKIRGDQKLIFLSQWKDSAEKIKGTMKALDDIVRLAE